MRKALETQAREKLSHKKMAEKLRVSPRTFYRWKKKYSLNYFKNSIKKVIKIQAKGNLADKKTAERSNISLTSTSRWKKRASLPSSTNFKNVAPYPEQNFEPSNHLLTGVNTPAEFPVLDGNTNCSSGVVNAPYSAENSSLAMTDQELDPSSHSLTDVDELSKPAILDNNSNLGCVTVNIPCTAENSPLITPDQQLDPNSPSPTCVNELRNSPVLDDNPDFNSLTDDGVEKLFQAILAESEAAKLAGLQDLDLSGNLLSGFDEVSERHLHGNGSEPLQWDCQRCSVNAAQNLSAAMASDTVEPAGTQQPGIGQSWLDLFCIGLDLVYH